MSGLTRRIGQLLVGLVLFGGGVWLGLQADLGVGPWEVLAGGVSDHTGVSFGRTVVAISVVVLLVGLAVGVRPGLGTVLNVLVIGTVTDLLLATGALGDLADRALAWRALATAAGIVVVAVGSALYLGAHLGPGPRDGLMVALVQRSGWPIGGCRALIESIVLVGGVLLGGPAGWGTVAFALGIGPCLQVAARVLHQTPVPPVAEGAAS